RGGDRGAVRGRRERTGCGVMGALALCAAPAVVDLRSGELVREEGEIEQRVLPLSLLKGALAASLLEHGLEPGGHERIVGGSDRAGRELAVALRKKIGAQAMLADARRLGFPLTLPPDAGDDEWGTTWSIGEAHAQVSPLEVALAFRLLAREGTLSE